MTTKHASDPSFNEYTMCGVAYDAFASGDYHEKILFAEGNEPVTCPRCRAVIMAIRRIKLGRLPKEAP